MRVLKRIAFGLVLGSQVALQMPESICWHRGCNSYATPRAKTVHRSDPP